MNRLRTRRHGLVVALLSAICLVVCLGGAPPIHAQQPPQTAAQEGFVPIDQLQPREELPATPLVTAAYSVAWIVVFVYVLSIWKRLGRVEKEIAGLNQRIASGGRR